MNGKSQDYDQDGKPPRPKDPAEGEDGPKDYNYPKNDYKAGQDKDSAKFLSCMVMSFFVIFSFIAGILLVYLGGKLIARNTRSGPAGSTVKSPDRRSPDVSLMGDTEKKGKLQVVFTDSAPSVREGAESPWKPLEDFAVPFGATVKTAGNSPRNVFSADKIHTIRAYKSTTFAFHSEDIDSTLGRVVEVSLDEGSLWVDSAGQTFRVKTAQGTVLGKGSDFQVETAPGGRLIVYSWKGDTTFEPLEGQAQTVSRGWSLTASPSQQNLPARIQETNLWQLWNKANRGPRLMAGAVMPMPVVGQTGGAVRPPAKRPLPGKAPSPPAFKPKRVSPPPPAPAYTPSYRVSPYPRTRQQAPSLPSFGDDGQAYPTATKTPSKYSYPRAKKRRTNDYRRSRTSSYNNAPSYTPPPVDVPAPAPATPAYSRPAPAPAPAPTPTRNPLDNNPTIDRVPGTGLHDKPVGPPGGFGLPPYN
jgi:hypothetical protein